ncbi:MAG: TetR family transcriptional regulator [Rhizobiaceae bacterium]|nr:TetR family transcriptional regulator [Rhizobiaceae bacterium]MCV0406986.1 TetR family transcriptional regulator [Rhizobiaceae bacterium]
MENSAALGRAETQREDGRLVRGEATRERVLDAAERLFAERGFDGVSIRQIAGEAGVTLGVVGFHGGSKLDLFKTILERRVATLNTERRRTLAELRSRRAAATLRDLLAAYMAPYLEIASGGDPQWRAYARLIARIVSDDRWYEHVRDLYDPVAREYLDAILEIAPGVDRERLVTAFVLSVASMLSIVASTIRIAGLSVDESQSGRAVPGNVLDYRETLIDYCAGGIERAVPGLPR